MTRKSVSAVQATLSYYNGTSWTTIAKTEMSLSELTGPQIPVLITNMVQTALEKDELEQSDAERLVKEVEDGSQKHQFDRFPEILKVLKTAGNSHLGHNLGPRDTLGSTMVTFRIE